MKKPNKKEVEEHRLWMVQQKKADAHLTTQEVYNRVKTKIDALKNGKFWRNADLH